MQNFSDFSTDITPMGIHKRIFVINFWLDPYLDINTAKSAVLIRDPCGNVHGIGDQINLNGLSFNVVPTIKYLGVYITATLDRRSTIAARVKTTYRSFYSLVPFFTRHRLSWNTMISMYHSLIVPIALYGLKATTLTKQNRESLRRMEYRIIHRMRELARDAPAEDLDIRTILRGRTIVTTSRVRRLKYWGHVRRRPDAHILQKALKFRLHGKLKVGRPCFTWHDSLADTTRQSGISNLEITIQDRKAHEDKCNQLYDNGNESE